MSPRRTTSAVRNAAVRLGPAAAALAVSAAVVAHHPAVIASVIWTDRLARGK